MQSPATSSRADAGAQADRVVGHSFIEEAVGKTMSTSKKRYAWCLSIGETTFDVCFTFSVLSGRRCVFVNDRLQHEEKQFRGSNFTHSWSMDGHSLSIMPTWAVNDQVYRTFDLSVDGRPFETLKEGAAAADLQLPKLKIEITSAHGLQGNGKVDPYCTCEIPGRHGTMFKTAVASSTSDPVWNHEHNLVDYSPGEPLEFKIVDKGTNTWAKNETVIARYAMPSQQFYPFGFEGILRLSRAGGTKASLRVKVSISDTPEQRRLRDIFDRCDTNRDGSLNKRELIKALRVDEEVAEFFQLPQQIRQEDGSRDAMERIFQEMDSNDDREVSWEEFKAFFARRPSSWTSGGSRSCPPTPEMSSASPAASTRSPRASPSPGAGGRSPRHSPPAIVLRAILPSELPGEGPSASSENSGRRPRCNSSPGMGSASPVVGLLEVRPKATSSRRPKSPKTQKSPKQDKRKKSPSAPYASAFDDLADFGGFDFSPTRVGEDPWANASAGFGDTASAGFGDTASWATASAAIASSPTIAGAETGEDPWIINGVGASPSPMLAHAAPVSEDPWAAINIVNDAANTDPPCDAGIGDAALQKESGQPAKAMPPKSPLLAAAQVADAGSGTASDGFGCSASGPTYPPAQLGDSASPTAWPASVSKSPQSGRLSAAEPRLESPWGSFPDFGSFGERSDFASAASGDSWTANACRSPNTASLGVAYALPEGSSSPPPDFADVVERSVSSWPSSSGSPVDMSGHLRPRAATAPVSATASSCEPVPCFGDEASPQASQLESQLQRRPLIPRNSSPPAVFAEPAQPKANLVDPWGVAYDPNAHDSGRSTPSRSVVDPWGYKYGK